MPLRDESLRGIVPVLSHPEIQRALDEWAAWTPEDLPHPGVVDGPVQVGRPWHDEAGEVDG